MSTLTALFRRSRQGGHRASRPAARYERVLLPPGMPGLDAAMYLPIGDEEPHGTSRFGDDAHGVATDETLAALRARAETPDPGQTAAPPTLPFTLPAGQRQGVPGATEVIAHVPLTLPPSIYDWLGGDEWVARKCGYCKAPHERGDLSWRPDALGIDSCPPCQLKPEWRSPTLPGLRVTTPEDNPGGEEMRLMAAALLATDPRSVRQRPDGKWTAAVPVGGRQKLVGAFDSRQTAETAYGFILNAFADAAGPENAREAGTEAAA